MKNISIIKSEAIAKRINNAKYYDVKSFNASAKRWCKALKDGRMIATVTKVSASGMSRNIKVVEMAKGCDGGRCHLLNFNQFLNVLGYRVNDRGEVILHGCGMDMIYSLTDGVCSTLNYLGILSDKEYKSMNKQANTF